MSLKTFFTGMFLLLLRYGFSQTYPGTGGIITDDGLINDYAIEIQDLFPETLDSTHGLVSVCINLTHSWVADLDIRLVSPSGVNMMLTSAMGNDGDNYENTCFTTEAPLHIISGVAPYAGEFRPFTNVNQANNGASGHGIWILRVLDTYAYADGGEMLDWSLTFGEEALDSDQYQSTSLPIIVLETDHVTVPNEPKIPGYIKVIFDDTGGLNSYPGQATFSSNMEIEVRGSSSQGFPKKSYSLETQDKEGDDLETPLLGMAKEEDWILYAPYNDKSCIRDDLTYYLGRELGRYAPNTRACEVVLNGDYQGIYFLEEKIKRDENRVDIKKLSVTDTIGDALTGGYILKIDRDDGEGSYFVSNHEGTFPDEEIRVVYEEPEGQDLHPKQQTYIQEFYHDFEDALYGEDFDDPVSGYRRYVDVGSLIDYFIICELGHNVDAYRLSTFFYKDRNSIDSLMHLGPLWDFNLAYGNVDYCESQYVEGWAYENSGSCGNTTLWWSRLLEDPYYRNRLKCRYDTLRQNVLSASHLLQYVEDRSNLLGTPSIRNYEKWPILGIYIWPNAFIGQTYQQEINYLKLWLLGRLEWMDANMPGECLPVSGIEHVNKVDFVFSPNPAANSFTIKVQDGEMDYCDVRITNPNGIVCLALTSVSAGDDIDISALPSGIYIVTVTSDNGLVDQQKLIIQH